MGISEDIITRQAELAASRYEWESVWRQIAQAVDPRAPTELFDHGNVGGYMNRAQAGPQTRRNSPAIYEGTGIWASDRLVSGIESLVTPLNEKWHGLAVSDPLQPSTTHEEGVWLERVRDFLFTSRYNPKSGFLQSHRAALRSCVNFGTGFYFVQAGPMHPFAKYQSIPLWQCFIDTDDTGRIDTMFRVFQLTARQAIGKFGEGKVSEQIRNAAAKAGSTDDLFKFIHAVMPRTERGSSTSEVRNSAYEAHYVEMETKHHIDANGFFDFPYIDYRWSPHEVAGWGEGPVMLALAELKTLQVMGKTELKASQQMIAPPLATTGETIMDRPDLNPRAVNEGALDRQGNLKIKPILTSQRPDFASAVMESRKETVKEFLYVNLFQTLLQNPGMTATEALIRADEKGQLLGPAGSMIQVGLSHMVDRELGIIERAGGYRPESRLRPPDTLAGRDILAAFTGPMQRLRRSNELVGIQRTWEQAAAIAQVSPEAIDILDADESLRISADVNGAPKSIVRQIEDVQAIRDQRQQMQQAQQAAALAEQGGKAANEIIPAVQNLAGLAGNQ